MLNPSPHTSQLIDAPAGQLEVDPLWQQDNPKADGVTRIALICHPNPLQEGTMMNKVVSTMFRFARDNGMHAVRFNFRGVGRSTGEYGNTQGEIDDTLAVLRWIKTQSEARELWLGGFSFGGYIAANVAQRLIEQGQALGLEDFTLTDLALIAPSVEKHDTSHLVLPVDRTFCVYGEHDDVVSPAAMQAFCERLGIGYHVLPDTGHFFHGKLGGLKPLLQQSTSGL